MLTPANNIDYIPDNFCPALDDYYLMVLQRTISLEELHYALQDTLNLQPYLTLPDIADQTGISLATLLEATSFEPFPDYPYCEDDSNWEVVDENWTQPIPELDEDYSEDIPF